LENGEEGTMVSRRKEKGDKGVKQKGEWPEARNRTTRRRLASGGGLRWKPTGGKGRRFCAPSEKKGGVVRPGKENTKR